MTPPERLGPGTGTRTVQLTGPAVPRTIDDVHELIARLWREEPSLTAAERMPFELALTELTTNIVRHAPTRPGHRVVTISVTVVARADRLEASVQDDGAPLAHDLDAPTAEVTMPEDLAESGRGLAIARAVTDELDYRRLSDGNVWSLTCWRHS